jgi:leader peptidase (prepilin peptidase) / N-methyltransferase
MVIILAIIGIFMGIAEYFVIEIYSFIYDGMEKNGDGCKTKKYCINDLKTVVSNIIHNSKLNKSNQMLVIAVTMILTLISYNEFKVNIQFYSAFLLNVILIIISFIDYKSKNIPNTVIIFTALVASLFILLGNISLADSLCGMLFGGGIMWLFSLIPGAIGGGDVKLMFALGLFLGFKGVLSAMVIAFFLASIFSFVLLVLKKLGRKDVIPFGPFLALGTIVVINFMNK